MMIKEYDIRLDALKTPILIVKKEHNISKVKEITKRAKNYEELADMLFEMFDAGNLADEYVWLICLTTSMQVNGVFEISHGSIQNSLIPVREITQKALLKGAVNVVIAHNHPSGDVEPSCVDIGCTEKINEGLKYVGINLLDHIVLGANSYGNNYYSFAQHDLIKNI